MTSRDHAALAALAAPQQGCFTREQATGLGFDRQWLHRHLGRGDLALVHPEVFRVTAAPNTATGPVWAGSLAVPGSVVSCETAAELLGLEGTQRGLVVVTAPHGQRRRVPGVIVRQTRDPWPIEHEVIGGLRITTARRVIVDLGSVLHPARHRRLCESAFAAKLTSPLEVSALVADLLRPGKRGLRRVTSMVDELAGPPPAQSELEAALHELVAAAGLPSLRRQAPLPGRPSIRGCVDGEWNDVMTVVEVDGRRWHARQAQMARDRERDGQAAEAGYLTIRFMYEHVVHDPAGTVDRLRRVRAVRADQLGRRAS